MDSIKHKMDTMVKEKEAATEKAITLEAEASEYQKTLAKFEKVKNFKKFQVSSAI